MNYIIFHSIPLHYIISCHSIAILYFTCETFYAIGEVCDREAGCNLADYITLHSLHCITLDSIRFHYTKLLHAIPWQYCIPPARHSARLARRVTARPVATRRRARPPDGRISRRQSEGRAARTRRRASSAASRRRPQPTAAGSGPAIPRGASRATPRTGGGRVSGSGIV
jgi:hypothetical protein